MSVAFFTSRVGGTALNARVRRREKRQIRSVRVKKTPIGAPSIKSGAAFSYFARKRRLL
jgi:hypothetical protein